METTNYIKEYYKNAEHDLSSLLNADTSSEEIISKIRKEIANTNNAKLIEQLEQEKKTYQEQYLVADKILKNNYTAYTFIFRFI